MDWRRIVRHCRREIPVRMRRVLGKLGYRFDQWGRVVYIDEWKLYLSKLPLSKVDALEISPGSIAHWRDFGFRSYSSVDFPDFDITKQALPGSFGVIIAEHVLEHLPDPYAAVENIRSMLTDDGVFILATPFLVRIHDMPGDYYRWTPAGMKVFLKKCGFDCEVRAWGNRRCIRANFNRWPNYGWWRILRNEQDFPLVVWAYARKSSASVS